MSLVRGSFWKHPIWGGLLALLAFLTLLVSLFYLRLYGTGGSPYRVGEALAPFPTPIALRVCQRFGAEGPWCLQGYFKVKLKGPLQGDPLAPCQGLSGGFLRACAAVQGLRLYGASNPFGGCARFRKDRGAYLACAESVGRAAFAERGFEGPGGAEETCAKGKGEAELYCRVGAAKKAIEWYGVGALGEAVKFCDPYEPVCAQGILEAMGRTLPREKALKACDTLPLPLFARCVLAFRAP